MKKTLLIAILFLSIGCSKDELKKEELTKVDSEVKENKPPSDFDVVISNISSNSVLISWKKAIDPENDSVSYSVFLGENKLISNINNLTFKIENIDELTDYNGKVIATDNKNHETIKKFSFKTIKYYLKYSKSYNYEKPINIGTPYNIIKTKDGQYAIVGSSSFNNNGSQFFVQKTDYNGNEIWKKFYGYQLYGSSNFKITQASNGFIIAGHHHVLKLDNDGNEMWYKKIDSYDIIDSSAEIKSMKEDNQGNIFLVGGRGTQNREIIQEAVITKLNKYGDIIWEKTFNPSFRNYFYDLLITPSNHLIILGSIETSGTTRDQYNYGPSSVEQIDFLIAKFDTNGEKIWTKTYGDKKYDFPRQIIQAKDGNYVFAGFSWGAYDSSFRRLIKIDKDGNEIWNNIHQTSSTTVNSLAETNDGFVLTGHLDFGDFGAMGIFKYDVNGNPKWEKLYQEDFTYLIGRSIVSEDDGGFRVIASRSKLYYYNGDNAKLMIYKTDPEGNFDN